MAKTASPEMHVVLSDQHYPYHDHDAEALTLEFLSRHQPRGIHLLGDVADFYQASRFDKDPERAYQLQDDLDAVVGYLAKVREAAPAAEVIYKGGNHEDRLRRYLWSQAKELSSLRSLSYDQLLMLDHFNIRWQPYEQPYSVGKLTLCHGYLVRKWSGYSARGHYEKFGRSVLHGHTHRMGSFFHRTPYGPSGAWENGCLCRLDPEYTINPDWQQGFSVVWVWPDGQFHVDQVHIHDGTYCWQGERQSVLRRKPR